MITKEELLSALITRGAITEYVTVKALLENPVLWGVKPKTLGVMLLRLRREGLVEGKKLGRAYEYKMTKKGLERHNYFYEKRKLKKEIEQFKRRIDEEYDKFILQKLLEATRD